MTPQTPSSVDWLDEILKQLQAQAFYDAIQAIEKLGASDDFTASVNAVGEVGKKFGYHIINQDQAKQAIEEHINSLAIRHAAEMSVLDQEITSLKAKLKQENP